MTQNQLTLLPSSEGPASGLVYLMTDGYLIKVGYTGRSTPRQRSGELRAQLLCFWPGSREDERRLKAQLAPWCVGGEWCRLPDNAPMMGFLRDRIARWGGDAGMCVLDQVVVNNLRRAA